MVIFHSYVKLIIYKPYNPYKTTIEPPVKTPDLGPAAEVSGRNGASAAIKNGGCSWDMTGILPSGKLT